MEGEKMPQSDMPETKPIESCIAALVAMITLSTSSMLEERAEQAVAATESGLAARTAGC